MRPNPPNRLFPSGLLLSLLALGTLSPVLAQSGANPKRSGGDTLGLPEPVQRPVKYFGDIHPVLVEHCVSCHGPEKQKGGLRLDSREAALAGGSGFGPAILPGKGAESPLLRFCAHLEADMEMPPKKPMLPEQTLAVLRAWIDQGADWPARPGAPASSATPVPLGNQEFFFKKAASHWAFQPVVSAEAASLQRGPQTIDAFAEAQRKSRDLSSSPRADAATLLKRLHFDLTGLPPSPADMRTFAAEFAKNPDRAIAEKVDQLLASPHFGERWGRHWLDLARYADTQDFHPTEDPRYPFAWTFRDYVINAFNSDKPYDRFLREQIAADLLDLPPDDPALAALGFLTVGPRFLKREDEQINDRIDVVTRGLMGLTVVCARCHDHKFDPIPAADFYALFGVFKSTEIAQPAPVISWPTQAPDPGLRADFEEKRTKVTQAIAALTEDQRSKALEDLKAKPQAYFNALCESEFRKTPPPKLISDFKLLETAMEPLAHQWNAFRKNTTFQQDPVLGPLACVASSALPKKAETLQRLLDSGKIGEPARDIHPAVLRVLRECTPRDEEGLLRAYGAVIVASQSDADPGVSTLREGLHQAGGVLDLQPAHVERVARVRGPVTGQYVKLGNALAEIEATHPGAPVRAMALKDRAKPIKPVIYLRGDPAKPGAAVDRRFLEVLDPQKASFSPAQSGRKELAERIASRSNPLTPRVWANHVWRHLLGRPLVKTTGDFGLQSAPPSHPELLDWLASALIQRNWSTKSLIRDIVLSQTYQQSSAHRPEPAQTDADNTWLWRANQRRRDFESMRDAMLCASGQLDLSRGGRAVNLSAKPFTTRRTVYGFVDRVNIDPLFTTFDFPSPDIVNTERSQTLVPQQALFALNDAFIIEQACGLASKAQETPVPPSIDPNDAALRALYQLVFQRAPLPHEETLARQLMQSPVGGSQDLPEGPWQHGFGSPDPSVPRTQAFHRLPYFDQKNRRYQGARAFPDRIHGYVSVSAGGGHPGRTPHMAAIRRWVAPYAGEFSINGEIAISPKGSGDGIRARVISSKSGLLAEWVLDRSGGSSCPTAIPKVAVESGEILDFTVDCREADTSDGFRWTPSVRLVVTPEMAPKKRQTVWDAQADFKSPPPPKLTPLERLAQALLITNEFMFID